MSTARRSAEHSQETAAEAIAAQAERQGHVWLLESLDRVNRAIQATNDLRQMTSKVLEVVLSVFACDRASLLYPCDPKAESWRVPMQRTRPEFRCAPVQGGELPMDAEMASVFETVTAATRPVGFGPGSEHPLPADLAKRFDVQSHIATAIYPKGDKAYLFVLHQCSYPRVWTPPEERLVQEIGQRLAGALTTQLMLWNLRESEGRLLAQHTVTQILADAATLEEATPRILRAVCESLDWDVGALWRRDREAGLLRCVEIWYKPSVDVRNFEAASRASTFEPGIGLPGRVWFNHEPFYIPDIVRDANFMRAPIVDREVLHAAFGFPILLSGDVLGVMEFFSHEIRQPDQNLLDMMATIGSQIGQFIERKTAEEALRRTQAELAHVTRVTALGQLAASIAHEVNQPLAAIIADGNACLNWLADAAPDFDQLRATLAAMVKDGHRAADVIQRIRQLATKTEPRKAWLRLNDVVRDVLPLVHAELRHHGVSLMVELPPDLPAVFGDRVQLQQVILNLVVNSIDAMAVVEGGPRELTIRTQRHGADHVTVAVQDTGVGVAPEDVDRLFDAFFTTKPSGMGMGLSISRSIVEAHGGRLWATPNRPHGAVLNVALPVATGAEGTDPRSIPPQP